MAEFLAKERETIFAVLHNDAAFAKVGLSAVFFGGELKRDRSVLMTVDFYVAAAATFLSSGSSTDDLRTSNFPPKNMTRDKPTKKSTK